jgi:hypothetical protein
MPVFRRKRRLSNWTSTKSGLAVAKGGTKPTGKGRGVLIRQTERISDAAWQG